MLEVLFAMINIYLFVFSLLRSKFDFIYPPNLFFGIWSISSIGYACMSSYWGAPLHFNTFIIMTVSSLLFLLGCELTAWHMKPLTVKLKLVKLNKTKISTKQLILFFLFEILSLCYIFYHQYSLAVAVNTSITPFDISQIMAYSRYATTYGNYSSTRLYVNIIRIIYVLTLIIFYDYVKNKTDKSSFLLKFQAFQCFFVPVLLTLTSVKMYSFGIISGYLIIYFALRKKAQGNYSFLQSLSIIKNLIFVSIGVIFFLGLVNTFLFSRIEYQDFFSTFAYMMKYVSSSIPAFDYYINHMTVFGTSEPGTLTFHSIYVFFDNIGLLNFKFSPILRFIPEMDHGFTTNVYTLYLHYIYDFSYIGILINLLNGIIYGYIYSCVVKKKKNTDAVLFYAVMVLPITVSFFAEYLWSMLNSHIVRLFCLMLFTMIFRLDAQSKNGDVN